MTDYFHPAEGKQALLQVSSLGLAYLGDAVHELLVRALLCRQGKLDAGAGHAAALAYVTAPRQAEMAAKIMPLLTQEEQDIYRRARNAAPHNIPKGATRAEYQAATALEALMGSLYIQGKTARLSELFAVMVGEEA